MRNSKAGRKVASRGTGTLLPLDNQRDIAAAAGGTLLSKQLPGGKLETIRKLLALLAVSIAASANLAAAGTITYTCDPSINATEAGTCSYLNSTIAGLYSSTFTNANANIYITMGVTGLGDNEQYLNAISYPAYLTDLTANAVASGNPIQASAVAALNGLDTAIYGSGDVEITAALGEALGVSASSLFGITSGGGRCTIGTANCYNGLITITTPANLAGETGQQLWWRQQGGTEPSNAYDFYSTVEHETDEILGTASCIDTQTNPLSNVCSFFGANTPSAVDLFRYSSVGNLIPNSALSTTPGAYFSYNGGATNGADGAVYNTLDNGNDYADFLSGCPTKVFVQDGTGCPGGDANVNITNDGGAEIDILNAVGYKEAASAPEPASVGLFGSGLALFAAMAWRRRRA